MERRTLRPLGIGEIVDTSINLCYRNFATFAKIAAVIAVPMGVIIFALDQIAFAEPDGAADGVAYVGEYSQRVDFDTFAAITITEGIVALFAFLLVIGASFRAVSLLYAGEEAGSSASLRFAGRRSHSMLWIGFVFTLGVVGASFAFLLPGIWLLVAWSLAIPALLAEGLLGTRALGRSFDLVRENWWRTAGAFLVGLVFIFLLQFLLGRVAAGLTNLTEDSKQLSLLISDSAEVLALILTGPLQAVITAVIYYDLRVRKEGFDADGLARQADGPAAGPEPPPSPPPPPPPPSTPSGW